MKETAHIAHTKRVSPSIIRTQFRLPSRYITILGKRRALRRYLYLAAGPSSFAARRAFYNEFFVRLCGILLHAETRHHGAVKEMVVAMPAAAIRLKRWRGKVSGVVT